MSCLLDARDLLVVETLLRVPDRVEVDFFLSLFAAERGKKREREPTWLADHERLRSWSRLYSNRAWKVVLRQRNQYSRIVLRPGPQIDADGISLSGFG